jgi:hypothetical protein
VLRGEKPLGEIPIKSPLPSPKRLAFAETLAQADYAQAGFAKEGELLPFLKGFILKVSA